MVAPKAGLLLLLLIVVIACSRSRLLQRPSTGEKLLKLITGRGEGRRLKVVLLVVVQSASKRLNVIGVTGEKGR